MDEKERREMKELVLCLVLILQWNWWEWKTSDRKDFFENLPSIIQNWRNLDEGKLITLNSSMIN